MRDMSEFEPCEGVATPSVRTILVTGGAGYLGVPLCLRLRRAGWAVRALDSLMYGQSEVATLLEDAGVDLVVGDIRDGDARKRSLQGIDAVVHLAAIVGDPACARDPQLSQAVNVEAPRGLLRDMEEAGIARIVFASTCSNYGLMADRDVLMTEESPLAPVSLYAEQKVAVEQDLLASRRASLAATCLRLATVYGVAPRMRFDLTVNEFTRDLWLGRDLDVFGEQFWRPYVHVDDVGRAVMAVLEAPLGTVAGQVFNVGSTHENYRKLDLIEIIREHIDTGSVTYVHREEDPRDYRVSFGRIATVLDYRISKTVSDGVVEVRDALAEGAFADPFAPIYGNVS